MDGVDVLAVAALLCLVIVFVSGKLCGEGCGGSAVD